MNIQPQIYSGFRRKSEAEGYVVMLKKKGVVAEVRERVNPLEPSETEWIVVSQE